MPGKFECRTHQIKGTGSTSETWATRRSQGLSSDQLGSGGSTTGQFMQCQAHVPTKLRPWRSNGPLGELHQPIRMLEHELFRGWTIPQSPGHVKSMCWRGDHQTCSAAWLAELGTSRVWFGGCSTANRSYSLWLRVEARITELASVFFPSPLVLFI
jgi:hypothetical protein